MTASSIPRSASLPCDLGVVVALEPDGLDIGERPRPAALSRVASSRIESLRWAPSTVPPIARRVRQDRPLPAERGSIPRVLSRSLATRRARVARAVDCGVGQVTAHDRVGARSRLVHDRLDDPGGDPLVATRASGGVGDLPPHTRSASFRRPARRQHDLAAVSVRLPSSVPAEGVVIEGHRDEEFDRRPDTDSHFRLERARQWGPPPVVGCGWPDMYVGTNRQLVDGPSWHTIYPGQRLDFISDPRRLSKDVSRLEAATMSWVTWWRRPGYTALSETGAHQFERADAAQDHTTSEGGIHGPESRGRPG